MQALTVDATYENGVLRPANPLPLAEHEQVEITIQPKTSWAHRTSGLLKWAGDAEVLRRVAEEDEFGCNSPSAVMRLAHTGSLVQFECGASRSPPIGR